MYKLRTSKASTIVSANGNEFNVLQFTCKCGELYTFLTTSVKKEICRSCKSKLPQLIHMNKEDLIKFHKDL